MIKIAVASTNPVKVEAVKQAYIRMFLDTDVSVEGVECASGVSHQPKTDQETYTGASNRITAVHKTSPDMDYWVGIEGGVEEKDGQFEVFAWIIVKSKDGKIGKARSSTYFLPEVANKLLRDGKELGEVTDIIFNETDTKSRQGNIGLLTDNAVDRTQYYVEPTIMAFIPFKNPELYTN